MPASPEIPGLQGKVPVQLLKGPALESEWKNNTQQSFDGGKQQISSSNLVQLTAIAVGSSTLAGLHMPAEEATRMSVEDSCNSYEQSCSTMCTEPGIIDVQLRDTCSVVPGSSAAPVVVTGASACAHTGSSSSSSEGNSSTAAPAGRLSSSAGTSPARTGKVVSNSKASKASSKGNSTRSSAKLCSSSNSATKPGTMSATTAAASTALAAAKLGLSEQMASALAIAPAAATMRDVEGRCCLHYAAGYGHEECVDVLLVKGGSEVVKVRDINGDLPLHLAAQQGHPMCAYSIAKACPASCLVKNKRGQSPIDMAAAAARGEVLNALLLACAGDGRSTVAVAAMRALLAAGAVPDTWAPNGSSALMLAAAADGVAALQVLLEGGATIELQDALGRSALMFAAGNAATAACQVLLDNNASLSARDRRGRAALEYAAAGSETAQLLQKRLTELETVANALQQQLLSEGQQAAHKPAASASSSMPPAGPGSGTSTKNNKKKKKKKAGRTQAAATAGQVVDAANDGEAEAEAASANNPEAEAASANNSEAEAVFVEAADNGVSVRPGNCAATSMSASHVALSQVQASVQAADACTSREYASNASQPSSGSSSSSSSSRTAEEVCASGSSAMPSRTYAELVAATVTEESSAAAEAPAEGAAAAHCTDWQLVVPKSKQRTGQTSSISSVDCHSSAMVAAGACSIKPAGRQPDGCASTKQPQHKMPPAGTSGGSNRLKQQQQRQQQQPATQLLTAVQQQSIASCNDVTSPGHCRQGSSHSFCSAISSTSYDSSSSCGTGAAAAVTAAAAAANAPQDGTCSCCSCSSRHLTPQQVHAKACMLSGSSSGSSCGTANPAAVVTAGSSNRQQQKHVHTSHPPSTTSVVVGGREAGTSTSTRVLAAETKLPAAAVAAISDVNTVKEASRTGVPAAAAAAAAAAAGFKAALLGLSSSSLDGSQQQQCCQRSLPLDHQSAVADRQAAQCTGAMKSSASSSCTHTQQEQEQLEAQVQQAVLKANQLEQQVSALQLQLKQQSFAHQQQLAAVLEDAAGHEAAAVAAASEAAIAETLQRPLVRQLLQAAAQQAVAAERARMQLTLHALRLPPASASALAVQLLLGQGAAAPAAAVLAAAAAANATAAGVESKLPAPTTAAAAAVTSSDVQPLIDAILSGRAHPTRVYPGSDSAAGATSHQEQQQQRLSEENAAAPQLPVLKLDLRSEYCGGSSSFVAPAKQQRWQRDMPPSCDTAKRSSCTGTAAACYNSGTPTEAAEAPACGQHVRSNSGTKLDWRRISTDSLFAGAISVVGGATRSSSSDSLSMSITDDAEVEETRMGSFGAIGGPPSTPPSSYEHSRSSCSPAVASLWASGGLVSSRSTALSGRGEAGCSLGTSPRSGSQRYVYGSGYSGGFAFANSRLAGISTVAIDCVNEKSGEDASSNAVSDVVDLLPDHL